jgi:hypothetical protein
MDDRSEFFAVLDQLTMSQIEARLPLWDDDQLRWVGEYLERKATKPAEGKKGAQPPGSAAFDASKANTTATVALIIAIGARRLHARRVLLPAMAYPALARGNVYWRPG